ncbi:hypothetical protein ARMGADRAFT_822672 [Armillaria gallica]|uniref:Uncharacterized protein n=1 Tax=Armillaria gallica TaxID=47427 RepID=A0A2H3CNG1_ARMGA|nr:hypothetical protein ARMGADRAFT_822672 [Armillaria gallica]
MEDQDQISNAFLAGERTYTEEDWLWDWKLSTAFISDTPMIFSPPTANASVHLCVGAHEHSFLPQRREVTADDAGLGMRHLHSSPRAYPRNALARKKAASLRF